MKCLIPECISRQQRGKKTGNFPPSLADRRLSRQDSHQLFHMGKEIKVSWTCPSSGTMIWGNRFNFKHVRLIFDVTFTSNSKGKKEMKLEKISDRELSTGKNMGSNLYSTSPKKKKGKKKHNLNHINPPRNTFQFPLPVVTP